MALAGIGLTGLIVAGLYQRFLVVSTDRAVIEAPVYRLAAPAAGMVEAGNDGLLRRGDPAARLLGADRLGDPGAQPVRVRAGRVAGPAGPAAQRGRRPGDPGRRRPAARPSAPRCRWTRPSRLRVGQIAEITVPGKPEAYRGQIERIDFRLHRPAARRAAAARPADRVGVPVIIRPDRPFDFENLGYAVSVTFL